ncbi:Major Facilitator Superfamily transporter [Opitutaceae bacterium TAV1]|nr:Major Facilitator Superfamily transporter [Opitutaceae bacterium TAV1]
MISPAPATDMPAGQSVTAASSAPSMPEPAKEAGPSSVKTWKIGTLTYTSAGLAALFCWLLFGDFAWSMRDRSVGPMSAWYLKQLGVPNLLFGLIISSFPALVGLILVPVISVKSDRHRGRWGRRIPFLLVTTPIAAFGMLGIAFTPFLAREVHVFFPNASEMAVAVICFGVFWAAFEFASITGHAVFNGLINDVVPKAMLGRFFGLFRAVSLIDGIIFNYWIMGHIPTHFTLILAAIGTFYGTAFLWVCFKVKEGSYPPAVSGAVADGKNGIGGVLASRFGNVRQYIRECFTNPYYVSVFAMLTTAALSFSPVNTFAIPYARSLGMSMAAYGKCLALTFCISLFLSYFIGWLSDVFHPIRVTMATLVGYAAISVWGALFANTAEAFAVGFVLHGTVSGAYVTSAASLGQRLYPHSRFAQFASAAGVCLSLSTMALGPAVGMVIDVSGSIYRYTFAIGGCLTLVALGAAVYVYGKFMKLGGPKGYTPPG